MVDSSSLVSVNNSGSISLVVSDSGSVWAVNWKLIVVSSESMPVGIRIREESSLKHLVVGWFNSRNQVAR